MNFFLIFTRESSHYTLQADKSFEPLPIILSELSHLQNCRVQNSKKGNNSKKHLMILFKIFTKYSTHHSLSANTGFKSLTFLLFEILHLQNCDVKFQNFQRAITQKNNMIFFKFHQIIYSLYSISCLKFLASNTYTFHDIAFAMSKISKKGNNSKIVKKIFSKISPNTSVIIPFQLTQVSSFYLKYFLRYGIYKISFRFFQRAVILQGEIINKKKIHVCYFSMRNPCI